MRNLEQAENDAVRENVGTLETLYTLIIGLALTHATYQISEAWGQLSTIESASAVILYTSFLFTIIPFYQGMGRFLYETHVVRPLRKPGAHESPMLLDTLAFVALSILFFVLGGQMSNVHMFFYIWSAVLIVDIAWSLLVWGIQRSRLPNWAFNNFVWLAASWGYWLVVVDADRTFYPQFVYEHAIAIFVVGRSIADYSFNWRFYYPKSYTGEDGGRTEIIYLAGPYSNNAPISSGSSTAEKRLARFNAVTEVAKQLIEAEHIVYSPLTMTHPIDLRMANDPGSDYWVAFDEAIMQHCSAIYILKLPGWDQSSGVRREIEFFKEQGIQPVYLSPSEYGISPDIDDFAAAFR